MWTFRAVLPSQKCSFMVIKSFHLDSLWFLLFNFNLIFNFMPMWMLNPQSKRFVIFSIDFYGDSMRFLLFQKSFQHKCSHSYSFVLCNWMKKKNKNRWMIPTTTCAFRNPSDRLESSQFQGSFNVSNFILSHFAIIY